MTRLKATLCACLALGLLAAGCGGGNDNGGESKTSAPKTSGGASAPAQTATVTMKSIQFNPKSVTLAKGGTVQWQNEDTVGHDVTGSGFKSGKAGGLGNGARFSHAFKKAGTYKYRCTVHPGMEGTVVVK